MKHHKMLIAIPTYNERENGEKMCREILCISLPADLLFVDDNSPDGTGEIFDRLAAENPLVTAVHRAGKLGIGSAHLSIIGYAYDNDYETLVTMDCDFTHSPSDIPRLLAKHDGHDLTLGSRYLEPGSLPGWNVMRRFLTATGHFLTSSLLGLRFDATGAFRVYQLTTIPREVFDLVLAPGYAFFFESLFVIHVNGFKINELAIVLPARTYGHSKMSLKEAGRSARQVISLAVASKVNPGQFQSTGSPIELDLKLVDPQHWDAYWERKSRKSNIAYDVIAAIYRKLFIRPRLKRAITRTFPTGARLLHAGCGGGQVDAELQALMRITALDISAAALRQYQKNNPAVFAIKHGDILSLDLPDQSFDGIYNLGVMEHFTEDTIVRIFREFGRVLVPGGKLVIFWPHVHAPSVYVLNFAHWILNDVLKKGVQLHPAEVSLLRSREQVERNLSRADFRMDEYRISASDLYIQAVIIAQKNEPNRRVELAAEPTLAGSGAVETPV